MTRPRVVVAETLHPEPLAWLGKRCKISTDLNDETLRDAEALIVRTYTRVDAALLERAPCLRVVGRAGVGTDNIDTQACTARGVRVVCTPEANTTAVVEYVLSAIFASVRPLTLSAGGETREKWVRAREDAITERELSECVVGVWGMGRIGSAVARALAGLAREVVYHDLRAIPADARFGATPVSRDELLAGSDILTLHVDGRESNRHLVGAEELRALKADALLINASRGMVVDAAALATHLCAHPGAGAVLDVHEPEPIAPDSPLLGLPNALLTAHVGAATTKAKLAMSWVVRDLWDAISG